MCEIDRERERERESERDALRNLEALGSFHYMHFGHLNQSPRCQIEFRFCLIGSGNIMNPDIECAYKRPALLQSGGDSGHI